MGYHMLFNLAYALCIRFNSYAIAHDLVYVTDSELVGITLFLTQLRSS